MDVAKFLVDRSTHFWSHAGLAQIAIPLILLWAVLWKLPPFKHSDVFHETMEYLGLAVILLVTALAFAYGGWIGLGALAFLILMR